MNNTDNLRFDAHDKTFGEILFSQNKFRIPRYQRPYAWEEDQIVDFWSDLSGDSNSYFIGTLIFNYENHKKDDYIEVIDGQQRLLTITILMAVIRDILKSIDETKQAELTQRHNIAIEDKNGNQTYRILCGDSTKKFFEEFIQNYESDITKFEPKNKEEKRIKNNYLSLKTKVNDALKSYNSKSDKLDFLKNLKERVSEIKVIWIKIESEEEAYEIFETVNARGVELSAADLLKNLIFKSIEFKDKDKDSVKAKWNQIEENIKETGTDVTRFLRYYWLSKHSFVTEKKLFKAVKNEISDFSKFLNDLHESSFIYNKLLDPDEDEWINVKNGNKIRSTLEALQTMKVMQCYVLFMSIMRNHNNLGTDPYRIFDIIEKFTFNYSSICNLPGNKVEKIYSRYARNIDEIVNKEDKKHIPARVNSEFEKLIKELKALKPSFEAFYANFNDLAYKPGDRSIFIKYVFSKINDYNKQNSEYILDLSAVNIEHVIPQKPSKEWKLSVSQIKDYVNKLGNLTLVHKKLNSKAGNKPLKEKLIELDKSDILMTKELVARIRKNGYKWDEEEINKRQKETSKLCYKGVWNF